MAEVKLYSYPSCPHFGKYGCTLRKTSKKDETAVAQHCGVNCQRDKYLRLPRFLFVGSILFLLNWAIVYYMTDKYHLGSFLTTIVITFGLLTARYYLQIWIGYAK